MPADTLLKLSSSLGVSADRLKLIERAARATAAEETLYIILPSSPTTQQQGEARLAFEPLSHFLSWVYNAASVVFYKRNTLLTGIEVRVEALAPVRVIELASRPEPFRETIKEEAVEEMAEVNGSTAFGNGNDQRSNLFGTVVLGGTFDHLHAGHKMLLTMSAWLAGQRIIVGVTDENLLQKKKHRAHLETLDQRLTAVRTFLRSITEAHIALEIVPIQDIYGPTASEPNCDALVCSIETTKGADSVNEKRAQLGFKQLDIFVVDVVAPASVDGDEHKIEQKMGSTAIREWLAGERQQHAP